MFAMLAVLMTVSMGGLKEQPKERAEADRIGRLSGGYLVHHPVSQDLSQPQKIGVPTSFKSS